MAELSPQQESFNDRLEKLEQENHYLSDQVKRLVKTENELYRIQEQLDRQLRLYRHLTEIGKQFNASFELTEILQIAIQFVLYELNFERCLILFRSAESNLFQVETMDGYYDEDETQVINALCLPLEEPALAPLLTGVSQVICSQECTQEALVALGHSLGMDEYIVLPLGGEPKQPLGLLAAGNTKEMTQFQTRIEPGSESILGLINLVGQASTAINNVNSYTALRENEKKYRTLFEDSRDAIFITTPAGQILDANQAMLELFGYTDSEMMALNAVEHYADPSDRARFRQVIEPTGSVRDFEVKFRRKDGTQMDCLMTATVQQAEDGRIMAYQGLIRDITEQKRAQQLLAEYSRTLEQEVAARTQELRARTQELSQTLENLKNTQHQLVEAEKMVALGQLVAGIAHEINTPVGVGVTAASLLEDKTTAFRQTYQSGQMKRADLEKYLDVAEQSSQMVLRNLHRAAELIQSFKQVAVDQSSEARREFAVKQYLDEILLSLRPHLKKTQHTIHINGDEVLTLDSYPGAFAQIVTNLVMNSLVHAYGPEEWGQLTFNLLQKGNRFIFEYSDDGKGIAKENLSKVFDPFFTTKRGQGGSGLGLHIIYNLVTQKLDGTIRCESEVGAGTSFIIEVPVSS